MSEIKYLPLIDNRGRNAARALRWVQKAVSKDEARPVLTGIRVNEHAEAADGFRFHAADVHIPGQFEGLWSLPKVRVNDTVAEVEPIEGAYPDTAQIIPRNEPTFTIAVDPKLLCDAISDLEGPVVLKFHGENSPMTVQGTIKNTDIKAFAIVMPMHLDESAELYTPYSE